MTKFDHLKKFILRKKTFRFRDVNEYFDQQPNSLNSYTTYLNSLRRAGLVKQTGRGQYKAVNVPKLRMTELADVNVVLKLSKVERELEEARHDSSKAWDFNQAYSKELHAVRLELVDVKRQRDYNVGEGLRLCDVINERTARIRHLEQILESERSLIVNQLERLNKYNELVKDLRGVILDYESYFVIRAGRSIVNFVKFIKGLQSKASSFIKGQE